MTKFYNFAQFSQGVGGLVAYVVEISRFVAVRFQSLLAQAQGVLLRIQVLLMLHVQVPIRLGCLAKARLSCHITFTSNIRFDMDARWTSGSFGTLVLTLAEVFRLALTANARPAPIRTPSLPLRSRES